MLINILWFVLGLFMLYVGAELLVRGASQLALAARISPLVVGLTVVAFGTSSPEIIVSFVAALANKADVAVGNIVGSNIANIALILGVSGLIKTFHIEKSTIAKEIWWMLAASAMLWIFSMDKILINWEGILLFSALIVFLVVSIRSSFKHRPDMLTVDKISDHKGIHKFSRPVQLIIYLAETVLGIFILVYGSERTIDSAVAIATEIGVSEVIIGLTMVAFGTSLPELATCAISMVKKESAILIGNIIGSNIFNILCVGGAVASFIPLSIKERVINFDMPVMISIAVILTIIIFTRGKISKYTGMMFLLFYTLYIVFTFFNQS